MNFTRNLTLSLLAGSLLLACSGNDDGADAADAGTSFDATEQTDAAVAALTLEELCSDGGLFVTLIEKFDECLPEFSAFVGGFPNTATVMQICEDGNRPYIDDGSIALGPNSLIEGCLTALQSADCVSFDLDHLEDCDGILLGQAQAGGSCDTGDVCADGLYCDESGKSDCGFCTALKPAGNSCETGDECLEGVCVDLLCAGDGLAGSGCEDDDHCRGRLVCDVETTVCTDPSTYQGGDSCTEFEGSCGFPLSGMYCNTAAVGGPLCQDFVALGADCGDAGDVCDLLNAEYCDLAGTRTCVPATPQADGEACNLFGGTTCMPGSGCDSVDEVCKAFAAAGESCEDDAQIGCSFLLECIDGTCQAGTHTGLCSE